MRSRENLNKNIINTKRIFKQNNNVYRTPTMCLTRLMSWISAISKKTSIVSDLFFTGRISGL